MPARPPVQLVEGPYREQPVFGLKAHPGRTEAIQGLQNSRPVACPGIGSAPGGAGPPGSPARAPASGSLPAAPLRGSPTGAPPARGGAGTRRSPRSRSRGQAAPPPRRSRPSRGRSARSRAACVRGRAARRRGARGSDAPSATSALSRARRTASSRRSAGSMPWSALASRCANASSLRPCESRNRA